MSRLRVLIIGCGNIAGGFDADKPADAQPLTHAGAYVRHGGYSLEACMDPDDKRRQAFQARWGVRDAFSALDEIKACAQCFDVVSICSPTALHAGHLQAVLELQPRLVFCEKPVTPTLAETAAWVAAFDAAGILFATNHTRRWAPDVLRLKQELGRGQWGKVRSAVGVYNKGVLNNGGHMVDLLHFLLGPLSLVSAGRAVWDFWEDDPTIPALLGTVDGVPVHLSVADARDFSFFELQIVTEQGVIVMENGGLQWRIRRVVASPHFSGYRTLDSGESRTGEYFQAMSNAAENIHGAILAGEALASTGRSAMAAQSLCEQIKKLSLSLS